MRKAPPAAIGGHQVTARLDILTAERTTKDGATSAIDLPKGNVLAFELAGGHRVMLRPSGTEPKIKYYFDVRVDMQDGETVDAAKARGEALLDALADGLAALTG